MEWPNFFVISMHCLKCLKPLVFKVVMFDQPCCCWCWSVTSCFTLWQRIYWCNLGDKIDHNSSFCCSYLRKNTSVTPPHNPTKVCLRYASLNQHNCYINWSTLHAESTTSCPNTLSTCTMEHQNHPATTTIATKIGLLLQDTSLYHNGRSDTKDALCFVHVVSFRQSSAMASSFVCWLQKDCT